MAKLELAYRLDPGAKEFEQLGRFVCYCSLVEICFHLSIRQILEIDEAKARLLIGEKRSGELVSLLKDAASFSLPASNPVLTEAINHLCEVTMYVNSIRAIVAHKPCYIDLSKLYFHNSATSGKRHPEFLYSCTTTQLKNLGELTFDLASYLREIPELGFRNPAMFLANCAALAASLKRSDLPVDPRTRNQKTAKPKVRRQSSPA